MKRMMVFILTLATWASSGWAVPTWTTYGGPGGGGNFTCVDVSSGGRVLVGSDVSGLYGRNGNSGNWTRMGELDGLRATQILDVQFQSENPTHALCGTGNGAYYSTNSGQTWSEVSVQDAYSSDLTFHRDVDAVGFGNTNADTTFAIVAWRDGFTINLATGTWFFGSGLGPLTKLSTTITDSSDARILKIVFDPAAGSGLAWATADLQTNASTTRQTTAARLAGLSMSL